ncbi:MAG: TolC family protein [Bacteroidales bacterium]
MKKQHKKTSVPYHVKKYIFFSLTIIISIPLCSRLQAQEEYPALNLHQLIDSALFKHYLLQANKKNLAIKEAEIEILKTNYQPRISTSATFSYWKFLMPNKQRVLGNTLSDVYTDISFQQTIYDWGENRARKAVAENEILLNDEIYRQIKNTIIWGVADAYFETLKADSEVEAHRNSLDQLNSQLRYADNLYSIGKVSGVDVLKIKVQISVEEKNLQKAVNASLAQNINLRRLCYIENREEIKLVNSSTRLYNQWKNHLFIADSLYMDVMSNHPALLASDRKIDIEEMQKEVNRLQSKPEIFSYGVASWEDGYIPFGDNFNYNIGFGISYTIPLWGGSSYKSKILQNELRMKQMNDEKKQELLNIKRDIDVSLNEIKDIKNEIANNEKIIKLARETLDNALVKYRAGQGPIIDVLDAQAILTETNIAYNKSVIAYLQAIARLHYFKGKDTHPFLTGE